MKRLFLSFTLMFAGLAISSCTGGTYVRGEARVATAPMLVSIGPGVWVVEDYHAPVFYSDGYYWKYSGGIWYRSHTHTSSWVRVRTRVVPRNVARIERPQVYVRYHARAGARVKRGPKGKVRRHHRAKRNDRHRDHRDRRAHRERRRHHH